MQEPLSPEQLQKYFDIASSKVETVKTHLRAQEERASDRSTAKRHQFQFSLAVGNGAGILFVGSMLSQDNPILPWWSLLPSAWCFVLGAVCGSIMLFFSSLSSFALAGQLRTKAANWEMSDLEDMNAKLAEHGYPITDTTAREKIFSKNAVRYGVISLILEISSAVAFLLGVVYPLVLLTCRAMSSPG